MGMRKYCIILLLLLFIRTLLGKYSNTIKQALHHKITALTNYYNSNNSSATAAMERHPVCETTLVTGSGVLVG